MTNRIDTLIYRQGKKNPGSGKRMFEDILARLSSFGFDAAERDYPAIRYAARKVADTVCDSCNLSSLPYGMYASAVDMTCGEFLFHKKGSGQLAAEAAESPYGAEVNTLCFETAVKQIREGDSTVVYAIGEGSQTPEQRLDALIHYLRSCGAGQIAAYRRLKW